MKPALSQLCTGCLSASQIPRKDRKRWDCLLSTEAEPRTTEGNLVNKQSLYQAGPWGVRQFKLQAGSQRPPLEQCRGGKGSQWRVTQRCLPKVRGRKGVILGRRSCKGTGPEREGKREGEEQGEWMGVVCSGKGRQSRKTVAKSGRRKVEREAGPDPANGPYLLLG